MITTMIKTKSDFLNYLEQYKRALNVKSSLKTTQPMIFGASK